MRRLTAIALLLAGCAEPDAPTAYRQAQELIGGRSLRSLSQTELAQAERLAAQARVLDPELHEATFTLAALYVARGAYEDATVLYRSLVEARPDDGRAYSELGLSLAAQGRYSGALRAYQDAVRQGEKSALIYARLGNAYQALGHLQENLHSARAAYRASLQLVPEQAEVRYQLARVEARLGQGWGSADADGTGARWCARRRWNPGRPRRAIQRGGATGNGPRRAGRGVWPHAMGEVKKPSCTTNWGGCCGRKGMVWGHGAQFERARVADPDLYPVYRYLGLIHSAEGRLDSALAAFAELADRQPGDAVAQVSIGIVHSRMGALDAAEEAFKAAVALGGAEGDAALKLGGLYVHQRRLRRRAGVQRRHGCSS